MKISNHDMQLKIDWINEICGFEKEPWKCTAINGGGGTYKPVANVFLLDMQNGGIALDQMCKGGGTKVILERAPRREFYQKLCAFIIGLTFVKKGGAK